MDITSIRTAVESSLAANAASAALKATVEVRGPEDWRNPGKFGVEVYVPNGRGGCYFLHQYTIDPQDRVVSSSVPWVTEGFRLGGIESLLLDTQERAARILGLAEIKVPARSASNAPLELFPGLYRDKGYCPTDTVEVLVNKAEPCLRKVINA